MEKFSTLAGRVKYLLEINGLSVTSAAKKIGVPQPRLNDIVLGRTKSPQTKTLQKIA
ncbi:helix-turn-helix domain-containing protein, partial [Zoogloea oleivorans]|uniref:helix-turn-helix domain-containing protein n=1 Tax=Zoogloea oleivorans TaxID=1552750 RepID=UPI00387E0482